MQSDAFLQYSCHITEVLQNLLEYIASVCLYNKERVLVCSCHHFLNSSNIFCSYDAYDGNPCVFYSSYRRVRGTRSTAT